MSKFTQNQKVQIGTEDNLPDGRLRPIPGRVICTDAHNPHDLTLIVLVQEHPAAAWEQMRQFNGEGLCVQAMNRVENESMYLNQNCYPVDEASTT